MASPENEAPVSQQSQTSPADSGIAIPVHLIADYRSAPPARPHPARRGMAWIVEYNPFYLLSALCMLLGCLLLSNTTTWQPVPLSTLLPLLGTLQVYELACLAIGLMLFRRLGPRRDALQLLALVLLFAVDVSFLMSEIATESFAIGAAVAGALFLLAIAKAAIILRVLKIEADPASLITGAAGLFALYAIPPLLTSLDAGRGRVEVVHFYWLWWLIGLSPLIFDAARKLFGAEPAPSVPPRAHQPRQRASFTPETTATWLAVLAVLPWLSLAVHTGVLHYVYDRPFMAPLAAPLLVGIALLIRPKKPTLDFAALRTLLLIAAAGVSLSDPARLTITLPLGVELGSAVVGGCAAWLGFAYMNAPSLLPYFAGLGLAGLLASWFGPTWQQVAGALRAIAGFMQDVVAVLVPKTRSAWGLLAVCMAFTFLALGALVSFYERVQRKAP